MTKIITTYRMPTDAECIEHGAHNLGVTVAEFCTLKIVSAAVVAQAKRKFLTMVRALPSGSPITWKIMHTWAETNFRRYRWGRGAPHHESLFFDHDAPTLEDILEG